MEPLEQVTVLMTLMRRLIQVMDHERAILRSLRLDVLPDLQDEKVALAEAYEIEIARLRCSPEALASLDPHVRAQLHDAFLKTLDYINKRDLLARLPQDWHAALAEVILPLRHYECAAELVSVNGGRFAYGTTIEQCLSYAAFDRIGLAQNLSRIGIALGGNSDELLISAKTAWMEDADLQGLRRLAEELIVEKDWAIATYVLDLTDQLIFPLLTGNLDEAALLAGAGSYSLLAQHFGTWYVDQRKWVDALLAAWLADPEHGSGNAAVLAGAAQRWLPKVRDAVGAFASAVDRRVDVGARAAVADLTKAAEEKLTTSGIEVTA